MRRLAQRLALTGVLGAGGLAATALFTAPSAQPQQGPLCSVWAVRTSVIPKVPFGAFMPDRDFIPGSTNPKHNIAMVDLPVNIGVIKCGDDVILYDSGWKQEQYHKQLGVTDFVPLKQELQDLGIDPEKVSKVVIGHAHWDHAGQLDEVPNATLYVQREELRGIEWALNYPNPHISATNQSPGGCFRSPACGYEPLTMEQVYGKVLHGKAAIVDGEMEIAPGIRIHPAFRAHTNGSQLLEVPTTKGKIVFGSDAYSSWEGIRDWMPANIQQTDTVQQFLAYEKCYKITGGYNNCFSAHEPLSYTDKYPLLKNSWTGQHGERMAEIALAPGEKSRHP
jgi:glyoxylase-like metal-dependent hydrolase (beta-lactamase superfamily II)